jgi:Regulator of ribonuclease activity B
MPIDVTSAALYKRLDAEVLDAEGQAGAMKYPDDANGDVLRRMEEQGEDLSCPRNVEFTVVFPNESAAKQFADHFSTLGYAASVELTDTVENSPWDVVVVKRMVLSHEEIGAFEKLLENAAVNLGGRNDGWGCLSSIKSPTPEDECNGDFSTIDQLLRGFRMADCS